jgi:CheY-like chemotaxis protein
MGKVILVADDESEIRKVVRRALEREGYQVLEAADGDEAIFAAFKHKPDLVLLDLHMPRLDGLAAMSEIQGAIPDAAVIVFSGDGDAGHADLALQRGACDYLAKPIDMEQLKTTVEVHTLLREA